MGREIPVGDRRVRLESDTVSGAEIKKQAGVDPNRMLTVWRPQGVKVVRDDEYIQVLPDDYFEDVPNWRYGDWD